MKNPIKYSTRSRFLFLVICSILTCVNVEAQGWKWASGTVSTGDVYAGPMAMDTSGNLIVAVYAPGTLFTVVGADTIFNSGGYDQTIITKTDTAGNSTMITSSDSSYVAPLSVATNAAGCIYLLGVYHFHSCKIGAATLLNPEGNSMYFISKISPSGTVLWAKNISSYGVPGFLSVQPGNLGVDESGNIYVSGVFDKASAVIGSDTLKNADSTGLSFDIYIAKYDSMGNSLWAKGCGGSAEERNFGLAVAEDGDFFIAGNYRSKKLQLGNDTLDNPRSDTVSYSYIAKFSSLGNSIWTKNIEGANHNIYAENNLTALAVDADENVYMTGSFAQDTIKFDAYTLTNPGFFLVKFDSSGLSKFAKQADGRSEAAYGLSVDHCGNVWVSGDITFPATTPPMSIDGHIISGPFPFFAPMFIIHYDTNGNYINSRTFASGGSGSNGILVDDKGNFYVKGSLSRYPILFGDHLVLPDSFSVFSSWETFVAKYAYDSFQCIPYHLEHIEILSDEKPQLSLFPNPVQSELTIRHDNKIKNIAIFNILGQEILNNNYNSNEVHFDVGDFPQGVYIVKVNHRHVTKFIKQ